MKLYLALRYAFSISAGHRSRVIRIILTSALSLTVMAIVLSVMTYLQSSRFDAIRSVRSFDIVVDGEYESELEELFPDKVIFQYGEGEALTKESAYLVRYIPDNYDGSIEYLGGNGSELSVPYSYYRDSMDSPSASIVMLKEASSGRVVPKTMEYRISGIYRTPLGYEFDDTMLFLPYSEADDSVVKKTAIKDAGDEEAELLRSLGYSLSTWKESEVSLYSAFMIENVMMYIVLSLLFVIIAVSAKQSVRIFYRSKRKERAELFILGMERKSIDNVFLLSFMIITLIAIMIAIALTSIVLPIAEALSPMLLQIRTDLAFPIAGFAFFSLFLIAITLVFSIYERYKDRGRDLLEVIHER